MLRKVQNILIIVSLLFLLVFLNLFLKNPASPATSPEPQASKSPSDPFSDEIAFFQDELTRTDLPEEARASVEAKFEGISMMATHRVEALTSAPTKPAILPATPTFVGTSFEFPDGIYLDPLDIPLPIAKAGVTVLTFWKKNTEERPYRIFSGYLRDDPQQGIIMIPQFHSPIFHQYDTPEKTGGVTIIAENGLIITLQAETGALYYFDAAQEWFVDANGSPLPTYTPSPTPVLTQTPAPMYPAP